MGKVTKVKGTKVKTYKGCPLYLYNGMYRVYLKGEHFDFPSLGVALVFIDECKPKRKR